MNLAYLGAKPRVIQPGGGPTPSTVHVRLDLWRMTTELYTQMLHTCSSLCRLCFRCASDPPGLHPKTLRVCGATGTGPLFTMSETINEVIF